MNRLGCLLAVIASCTLCNQLLAQAAPPAPSASIVLKPAPFGNWTDEAHPASLGATVAVTRDTAAVWWGLGTGATIGAAAALTLTQAFCGDDNGCVARSVGAALAGSLLGGVIGAGMDY